MSEKICALAWPDGAQAQTPLRPRIPDIERFKNGSRKTVLMLGDPVKRQMHWNADLKRSVPCFRPAACPFCSDPKFTKTAREEGFAPVMVLNAVRRQWEQAVAVFTRGGLTALEAHGPGPYRGWTVEVCKLQEQPGRTAPMQVKKLAPVPESFPSLPPEFSVRAVMLREWFPEIDHAEPITWIDPIKVERRARPASSVATMELDAEEAALLAERVKAMGLSNLAGLVTPAAAPPAAVVEPADDLLAGVNPEAAARTAVPPAAESKPGKAPPGWGFSTPTKEVVFVPVDRQVRKPSELVVTPPVEAAGAIDAVVGRAASANGTHAKKGGGK